MFKSLFAIQWQSMFVSAKNKRGKSGANTQMVIAIVAIIFSVIAISFPAVLMFEEMSSVILNIGQEWIFWSMIAMMSLFAGVISSIFSTYQLLFVARDSELLLSLPIPPKMILGVKILNLYLLNLLVHVVLLVYASIGFLRAGGSFQSVFLATILSLFLPLLSLSLSSIVATLISILGRYIPFKNFFIILIALGGFAAYYYFVWVLSDRLGELLIAGINFAEAYRRIMPPIYAFGVAIQYRGVLQVLQYLLWVLIPFGVVFGVISMSFRKLMTKKEATLRVKYKGKVERKKPLYFALIQREIRRLMNLPMVFLNAGMGMVGSVIFAGLLIVQRGMLLDALSEFGDMLQPDMMSAAVSAILMLLAFFTNFSASSLSLEGQQLWNLKSLPIRSKDILLSKAAYSFILSYVPIVLASVVYIAVFSVPVHLWPIVFVLPLTASLFSSLLGINLNISFPKLVWQNETVAVKQSLSVFLHMIISMAITAISIYIYLAYLTDRVSPASYVYGLSAVLAVLDLLLYLLIVTRGAKTLEAMDA